MTNITLSSHSLRVTRKNTPKKFEKLNRIGMVDGANNDLFDIFSKYLTSQMKENGVNEEKLKKRWIINNPASIDEKDRTICGTLSYGEYGVESDIVDVDTNTTKHHKGIRQAEMIPYYFLIHIPLDSDIGYVILERYKNYGIQGIFLPKLKSVVDKHLKQRYLLTTHNIFSKEYFDNIMNNCRVSELRVLTKYTKGGSDLAGTIEREIEDLEKEGEVITVESILKASFGLNAKKKLKVFFTRYINGDELTPELFEECKLPPKYTKLSLVLFDKRAGGKQGKRRTVKIDDKENALSLEERLLPHYDISNSVKIGENGLPILSSIDELAKSYLNQLILGKQPEIITE